MFTLEALRTELTTDPRTYGYAARITAGQHQDLADLLNLPRVGVTVKRRSITPRELINAIDTRDFNTTQTIYTGSWLESVLQLTDGIELLNDDGTNNLTRQNLNRLLEDTNGSQTRLNTISRKTPASRAEELFGEDAWINNQQVADALR